MTPKPARNGESVPVDAAEQQDRATPVGRPLRRDAERNRERILESAAIVFAEHGLDATLDDIAAHAGVGVATVYRRFRDKDALVEAMFVDRLDQLVAVTEEALAHPDAWGGVVLLVERSSQLQMEDRGLRDVVHFTRHGMEKVAQVRERLLPGASRVFARAQADGVLRDDVSVTDLVMFSMMLGAAADYSDGSDDQLWRRYLQLFLDGLLTARSEPTPLPRPAMSTDQLDEIMASPPHRRERC